jgi:cyanophycinase
MLSAELVVDPLSRTIRSRFSRAAVVLLLLPIALTAGGSSAVPRQPIEEIPGSVLIWGGGKVPEAVSARFLELAWGEKARLVVLSAAKDGTAELWQKQKLASVEVLLISSRDQANDSAALKPLTAATAVWLQGDNPARLVELLADTALVKELKKLLGRGGALAGAGKGAAVLGEVWRTGKRDAAGLSLLPGAVLEIGVLRHNRVNSLVEVVNRQRGLVGLGIDEQTDLLVRGRRLSVVGDSYAVVCLAGSSRRPLRLDVLTRFSQADLIALSRAAIARSSPPFPAARPPVSQVAKGSLVIGGGGGMPEEVWKRFIKLAGGPDAPIVVIPTAMGDQPPADPGEAKLLRKAGAKKVRVLHARNRAEAEAPQFLEGFKDAGGIWFTGGRQWRFVDSYLDTKAQKAFHEVLARGGVIGGSSAGASIQADYMVRGNPLGNLDIMAEGYERGLGFVSGVAIDQHFFKRKRTQDMTELMAVYPQLLGIGIDEGTALIVQGKVMEVVGRSKVAVYDRRRAVAPGGPDYQILTPGMRYNLKLRRLVEKE